MKVIVLEGPDGGGKSFLAKELERIGYKVLPFGVPPFEVQKDTRKMLDFFRIPLEQAMEEHPYVVCDRLHLSDYIYGPLMRGGSVMSKFNEGVIDTILDYNNGQVVICLPPMDIALQNYTAKLRQGLEYVTKVDTWREVYVQYYHLVKKNQPKYLWYDYTLIDAESFASSLKAMKRVAL